jgi:GDP-L-fucose synthase
MHFDEKIYVAGHLGMAGSSIVKKLRQKGFSNLIFQTKAELDLTNQSDVYSYLNKESPDYVVIASAKVGGIYANNNFPAEFIYQNLMIEINLIHGSYLAGVNNLLFLGSSCIYPKESIQPIKEEYLLNGTLEPTNEPYAISKIAGIKLCESYNRQYGTDYRSIMPTNLYGPNDNFHIENSHVIPALIRRFHEAKEKNYSDIEVWGSGNQLRDFLHVDDMADASAYIMTQDDIILHRVASPMLSHINVGSGKEISIKEISYMIRDVVEYPGEIYFNAEKPDGTPRKLLEISKIENLGWKPKINLIDGLRQTYSWFLENHKQLRE